MTDRQTDRQTTVAQKRSSDDAEKQYFFSSTTRLLVEFTDRIYDILQTATMMSFNLLTVTKL